MDRSDDPRVALLGHGSWGRTWPGTCTCAAAGSVWSPAASAAAGSAGQARSTPRGSTVGVAAEGGVPVRDGP
jgi:hypothetical protein